VTSLTIQASLEVIQLLEKLFAIWTEWEKNEHYYIHTLLPELQTNHENGSHEEKIILQKIQKISTKEEWEQLASIAGELKKQRESILQVSRKLEQFFSQNDFEEAKKFISAFSDISILRLYETISSSAINKILLTNEKLLQSFQFEKADQIIIPIKPYLTKNQIEEIEELTSQRRLIYSEKVRGEVQDLLLSFNYEQAKYYYHQSKQPYPLVEFNQQIEEAQKHQATKERRLYISKTVQVINQLLEQYKFTEAEIEFRKIERDYTKKDYLELSNFYKRKQAKELFLIKLNDYLHKHNFISSDNLFHSSSLINHDEYLEIKSPYVKDYVSQHYHRPINLEKALALSSISKNLLLSARAGSGKTTVLACKASMLMDCESVNPDQILILAFNKNAAHEIKNRISKDYVHNDFENARTFHSLAHQLVRPTEDLLFDEKDDVNTQKMSLLIQEIVNEKIKNPAFIEKMYEFFRKELIEIENAGFFLNKNDYFDFRRNLLQVTLNGEKVKSVGEKFIADYLFEHDISYVYEKTWFWGDQIYRPDFSMFLNQNDYIIEHWGIDENDPLKKVPNFWSQSWDEYHQQMYSKRAFWKEKDISLTETSIQDLCNGREAFELVFEQKLKSIGIEKAKLPHSTLIQKVKDHKITHMSGLFTQFIQRAKKLALTPVDVQKLIRNYKSSNERESIFLDLACRIFFKYEQVLRKTQKIDFDDLIMQAIKKIHDSSGECEISLGKNRDRKIKIKDLQWILIDEYQDFSELFFRLISAIKDCNPRVRLFCVGDDWQAINGFAGSDLKFFTTFNTWVDFSKTVYLLTNFRSKDTIVRIGNKLMQGFGKPSVHLPENIGGNIQIDYIDDVWIELRNDNTYLNQKMNDERFLVQDSSGIRYDKIIASRYIKRCYEIITSPENLGKKVAILSRTNWIDGVRLTDFKRYLISNFTQGDSEPNQNPGEKIDIQTVHKYKGLESDIVILLNVCDGSFPLLHPDNALFNIFGKTLKDAYDEERRLFYVALTRAKSCLYILTEKGRESVFLKEIIRKEENKSNYGFTKKDYIQSTSLPNFDDDDIPF
jgi:DNA helicase-4